MRLECVTGLVGVLCLIDEVVNSMDTDQKLKLLQLSLHYVIPKLRSTETSEKPYEDLPLFVDVEVIKSYEKTGGWTNDVVPQRNNN